MSEGETVRVGISDIQIVNYPNKLRTAGLGSCVGIVLYDSSQKVAGMIHSMLPDHTLSTQASPSHPGKYVDTAIPFLIEELQKMGINRRSLKSKLAGGAEMFKLTEKSISRIGHRNVLKVREMLAELAIPIVAEETGGTFGRTIEFDTLTNQLLIRTASQGERFI